MASNRQRFSTACNLAIGIISIYRRFLSPCLPTACRFQPTCSAYAILAIRKYGLWRGTIRSIQRLLRCHPFHPGGYDPVR